MLTISKNLEFVPQRKTEDAVGYDCITSKDVKIPAGQVALVPLGFKTKGACLLFGRSSLHKMGFMLANGVGVIDADYRGEVMAALYNFTDEDKWLPEKSRIVQLVPIGYAFATGLESVNEMSHDTEAVSKLYDNWEKDNGSVRGVG